MRAAVLTAPRSGEFVLPQTPAAAARDQRIPGATRRSVHPSRAFNTQNDTFGGFHEGLTGLSAFQDTYYSHILTLNVSGENDAYTVSGLDASTLPTQISWEYVGGDEATNATFTDIYGTNNTIHTPLIIAVYSSHLDVMANRQIITRV